jgi:DNA sulfur modification protein DndD
MILRAVELRDWRSYRSARFEFPRPTAKRNVVLIMAPNEHGKTSFFEAVTLGIFGREGLPLIPRARAVVNGSLSERLNLSYSQFLAGALHRRAIADGRLSCAVTIEVELEDGDPLLLTRKWHFRSDGSHKQYDDDLLIFEGAGRVPVAPPASTEDRDAWFRDYIARHFIPSSLAEFFLFDGEQVQRYASRDMGAQVRLGIEGLLGLPVLRALKESLDGYATSRRSSAASPSDQVVKTVELEIAKLQVEVNEARQKKDEAERHLPELERESDALSQQLGSRGEGTVAMVAELLKEEERYRADAVRATEELRTLLAEDVALGLAGAELRRTAIQQLQAEAKRENWETGRNEGNANLDRFLADLTVGLKRVAPPLSAPQTNTVIDLTRASWEGLWHPPPAEAAEGYMHDSLRGTARSQAIERLSSLERRSTTELTDLVQRFRNAVAMAETKKRERLEIEHTAPEAEQLSSRLKSVSEQVGALRHQRDEATLILRTQEAQLGAKRQELGRHMERMDKGAPALKRAALADKVSALLETLINEAVPSEVGEVAREMTTAWKAMAHMSDRVDRIEITDQCEVRMLNARGENLHDIEKSAGASQVFTQALICAVTNVSGREFPFVVDTPLARLSKLQRIGVLKTFTERSGQVILLSTDEEVVDDKLDAIRDRLSAGFLLDVKPEDGVAITTVRSHNF